MKENPLLQDIKKISDNLDSIKEYFIKNKDKKWNKSIHKHSSNSTKINIKTILILNLRKKKQKNQNL